MRWYKKQKPSYKDCRVVRRFLWKPVELNGLVRWLEFATMREQYLYNSDGEFYEWVLVDWMLPKD